MVRVLWIDGVGGFGMWEPNSLELGRSVLADKGLEIQGDLPGRAVRFERIGEDWFVNPITQVSKNGSLLTSICILQHGDRLRLGPSVELLFEQSNPWSTTATLKIVSRHRWSESMDGLLLLGQTCLLGPSPKAHVRCRDWKSDLLLFRKEEFWMVRPSLSSGVTENGVRGETTNDPAMPLAVGKRFQASDASMTLL